MNPKVSVAMISFNQEKYIGEAIESVLCQQTNFPFEIVIGEDCSTDNTLIICRDYQKKHPETIRVLEREKNLGMAGNFISTLTECTGEYLAILEGDDFWTDPLKLQKQVGFLDANPDFAIVFARTEAFFQDEDRQGYEIPPPDIETYNLENLLKVNFIATCSVMYRKDLLKEYPHWFNQLDMLDWPLHILFAQRGKIGFLNEKMAKYRIHSESNFSSRKVMDNYLSMLKFYRIINPHLNFFYKKTIFQLQSNLYRGVAKISKNEGRYLHFIQYITLALQFHMLARLTR